MQYKIIEKLNSIKKDFYTLSDLEKVFGQKRETLHVTVNRLVKKGWLVRLMRGLYRLSLSVKEDEERIANQLYWPSYLSFESALAKYGIISQIPYTMTFATPNKTKKINIEGRIAEYRQLKKELFFGYVLKDRVNIAEPEKALLDQVYLVSLGKGVLDFGEIDLKAINVKKILKWSLLFPARVQVIARRLVGKDKSGKVRVLTK